MSGSEMTVLKPEATKTFIWLQCYEGSIQQVEQEVAMFCPMICREILQTNMGYSKKFAIVLPQRVSPAILNLILDYCRFHQVRGRSNKERKFFDESFTKIDAKRLCELTSAADSLQLKALVDLTSKVLARMIEGKTPEEIRNTFHLPDDLTEEEKLEPLKNTTDDPRIRLLNRLYARKRKELKKSQKLKNIEEEEKKDERSIDDLLSFINGDRSLKDAQSLRKKNGRREDILRDPSNRSGKGPKERAASLKAGGFESPSQMSRMQGQAEYAFNSRIMLDDVDDGLDPVMKEELDREVEDFARRLNCDWPERMQEILSLSQERRLVTNLMVGSSSSQRCTGIDGRAR
ncbi:SKP1-like protein 21 [Platanthera zijinensis]|uniref:SKP1-like protein 21 n=1 Tax=Platanthera zijinensis TaxID=2320716 RepID=A0AAP0BL91_9ASPA